MGYRAPKIPFGDIYPGRCLVLEGRYRTTSTETEGEIMVKESIGKEFVYVGVKRGPTNVYKKVHRKRLTDSEQVKNENALAIDAVYRAMEEIKKRVRKRGGHTIEMCMAGPLDLESITLTAKGEPGWHYM